VSGKEAAFEVERRRDYGSATDPNYS
jgi:hypothetical protein